MMETRNRHLVLAMGEIGECQRDLSRACLAPASEQSIVTLSGVAAGLDRASERIKRDILNQQPPAPADAPVVTEAMEEAAAHALEQQYRAESWEEAKDVIEGIDLTAIITAALAAQPKKDPSA